ncbi:MAG: serine/threonine-protein kinase [Candidatus Altimarinota bacterium]
MPTIIQRRPIVLLGNDESESSIRRTPRKTPRKSTRLTATPRLIKGIGGETRSRIAEILKHVANTSYIDLFDDVELIGKGGMGEVYGATMKTPDGEIPVAIKTIKGYQHQKVDRERVKRFEREAKILVALRQNDKLPETFGMVQLPNIDADHPLSDLSGRKVIIMRYYKNGHLDPEDFGMIIQRINTLAAKKGTIKMEKLRELLCAHELAYRLKVSTDPNYSVTLNDGSTMLYSEVDGDEKISLEEARKITADRLMKYHKAIAEKVIEMTESMMQMHDAGYLHRDIKPDNTLIDDKGRVMLADFGLAVMNQSRKAKKLSRKTRITSKKGLQEKTNKDLDVESLYNGSISSTQHAFGTPAFMAPELICRDKAIRPKFSRKSDQYALGVSLFQLITGKLPFSAATMKNFEKQLKGYVSGDEQTRKNIYDYWERSLPSDMLMSIVQKMLNPDPEERYEDLQELIEDLKFFIDSSSESLMEGYLAHIQQFKATPLAAEDILNEGWSKDESSDGSEGSDVDYDSDATPNCYGNNHWDDEELADRRRNGRSGYTNAFESDYGQNINNSI